MSDLFGRLAASAVGQLPAVRPLILSRYEPGLELVATPTVPEPVPNETSVAALEPDAAPSTVRPPRAPARQVSPAPEQHAEAEILDASDMRRPPHRVRQRAEAIAPEAPTARTKEMRRQAPSSPTEKAPEESRLEPANVATRQPTVPEAVRAPARSSPSVRPAQRTVRDVAPPTVPADAPTPRTIVETAGTSGDVSISRDASTSRDASIGVDSASVPQPNGPHVLTALPSRNRRVVTTTDLDHPTVVSHREALAPWSEPSTSARASPVPALETQELHGPSVIVTIGRIEVRAITRQVAPPPVPSRPPTPRLSLDAYLEEREERRR